MDGGKVPRFPGQRWFSHQESRNNPLGCRHKAWNTWCPHQEDERKQTFETAGGHSERTRVERGVTTHRESRMLLEQGSRETPFRGRLACQ